MTTTAQAERSGFWRPELGVLVALGAVGLLLLLFWLIADQVRSGGSPNFDRAVILLFRNSSDPSHPIGPAWLQEGARDLTALGSHTVLAVILLATCGLLVLLRQGHAALFAFVCIVGGVLLSHFLKIGFARPRPDIVAPAARVFTASFPSGHATLSAVVYLTLGALLARTYRPRAVRLYVMSAAAVLTMLVGLSRIYLGVHYPTDVLAGWCIGTAWALLSWTAMRLLQHRGSVEPPGTAGQDRTKG